MLGPEEEGTGTGTGTKHNGMGFATSLFLPLFFRQLLFYSVRVHFFILPFFSVGRCACAPNPVDFKGK